MSSLLPKVRDDFGDSSYWNRFNAETTEFEWYGNYEQLKPTMASYLLPRGDILLVGCGNSALSANLYDASVANRIVNSDYEEATISQMRRRNASRPEMTWVVEDMKEMSFPDASFDCVLDKGALDALMSSPDLKVDADLMMGDVARVLKPGGRYLCVSLLQEFVFDRLALALKSHYLSMDAHILEAASGGSNHVPFMVVLTKAGGSAEAGGSGEEGAKQATTTRCWFDEATSSAVPDSKAVSPDKCWAAVFGAQQHFKMKSIKNKLRQLQPGNTEHIELWGAAGEDSGGEEEAQAGRGPKYTLKVVDMPEGSTSGGPVVAAFIVPQGREHEFLFSTEDGLRQIAASASCARLLSVSLMRGHRFESLAAVQAEITPAIVEFSPEGVEGKIQVMTTADSLGNRDVVASGQLASGDEYFVEESEIDGALVRRLVFAANSSLIQTEVRLLRSQDTARSGSPRVEGGGSGGSGGGGGKKKKNGSKNKKKDKAKGAVIVAAPAADEVAVDDTNGMLLDNSYLCFEYHRAIIAGLIMSNQSSSYGGGGQAAGSGGNGPGADLRQPAPAGMVLGLGGGALPMSLRHFFPHVSIVVTELDPSVVQVAKEWFGFRENQGRLAAQVGDGLEVDLGIDAQVFVVIDVDSKDNSVGMSCPPQAFLENAFLLKIKASLRAGGVLAVNVAARSTEMYRKSLAAVLNAFSDGKVYFLKAAEDDVNTVIFAVKGATSTFLVGQPKMPQSGGGKKKPAATVPCEVDLKGKIRGVLLEVPGQSADPLGLLEMIEGLKIA